jgi:hypothetical protein
MPYSSAQCRLPTRAFNGRGHPERRPRRRMGKGERRRAMVAVGHAADAQTVGRHRTSLYSTGAFGLLRILTWVMGEVIVLLLMVPACIELTPRGFASGNMLAPHPWSTRIVGFLFWALPALGVQAVTYIVDRRLRHARAALRSARPPRAADATRQRDEGEGR